MRSIRGENAAHQSLEAGFGATGIGGAGVTTFVHHVQQLDVDERKILVPTPNEALVARVLRRDRLAPSGEGVRSVVHHAV